MSKKDDRLIQFGMTDVQERFINYTSEIDKLSKLGFSKISGEILSQLVKGIPKVDEDFLVKINHNDVEIILSRVGDEISKQDKGRIKKILDTKEINEKDHSLLYFLKKLINIYDEQRELDNTIRIFVETCNKYLTDKKVIYDESAIDIYIEKLGERLELSNLSSGEKQIVSIFSKIYLTIDDKKFIILIDEPELSLSVFWQEMLLPDILNSGKCSLLLAATHSPFIYEDNKVEQYAVNLHEYIIERK